MADVTSSDISRGPEVKWYAGGVAYSETVTVLKAQATAGGIVLTKTADYGMLLVVVNGVQTAYTGFKKDLSTRADEDSGVEAIKYSGIAENDVVDLYYIDAETTGLTHIMSAKDFKTSTKVSTEKIAVHGQTNKITVTGAAETTGSFSMLQVEDGLVLKTMFSGARTTGPAADEIIWSNKITGFKDSLCLVGKKMDSTGAVTHKWGLIDVTLSGNDQDFPTEGTYTDSLTVDIGYLIEWSATSS